MAITGTGTQTDPFLVHSYDEIKEALTSKVSSGYEYVRLENDINCNDYGLEFEWSTISLKSVNNINFDLNGHTIKNMLIKSGNALFSGMYNNQIIHNGRILNVFNDGGNGIIIGNGMQIQNVSMSINGTGLTGSAFQKTCFKNCSVYFKSKKLNNSFLYTNITSSIITAKNCDFYFDIDNVNGIKLFNISNGRDIDGCRFRGKAGGTTATWLLSSQPINNCVVEIDTSNLTSTFKMISDTSVNTIVNTEVSSNIPASDGTIGCTTAQMRDADYLNSIGFTVVKVGE